MCPFAHSHPSSPHCWCYRTFAPTHCQSDSHPTTADADSILHQHSRSHPVSALGLSGTVICYMVTLGLSVIYCCTNSFAYWCMPPTPSISRHAYPGRRSIMIFKGVRLCSNPMLTKPWLTKPWLTTPWLTRTRGGRICITGVQRRIKTVSQMPQQRHEPQALHAVAPKQVRQIM